MTEPKKSDGDNIEKIVETTSINVIENDESVGDTTKKIEKDESDNNNDEQKCIEFSKKLQVGGKNILVVNSEDYVLSGDSAPSCCIIGSPEHVAALKSKIDELKIDLTKVQEERAQMEAAAQTKSEQVAQQLDRLASELKELGHGSEDSEQTIHATVHTFGVLRKLEIIADEDDEFDYNRLWRIPRVRQYWHLDTLHREAGERASSYTELFWDLIFVAVVQNLGHILVEDVSFETVQRFIITFYPVFRIWLDVHNYLNVYSSKDILEKFLLLWEMCLLIVMGTHTSNIFQGTSAIFIISYVVARLTFFLQYFLLASWIPMFRISLTNSAWGIFIPCVLWIIAIFTPSNKTIPLLWSAIVFEVFWTAFVPVYYRYRAKKQAKIQESDLDFKKVDTATSITPHKAMRIRGTEFQWKWNELFSLFRFAEYRPAINIEHWSERYGVFAIICLGEGIFGIVYSSLNPKLDAQLAKAILALFIAYNLHWIYFDVDASRQFQHALRRHVITGVLFGLAHLPLNMALIAFGSSLRILIQLRDFPGAESIPLPDVHGLDGGGGEEVKRALPASADSTSEFPASLRWLFCVSLAISIYCMATIGMLHKGLDSVTYLRIRKEYRIALRIIVATIILLLPLSEVNSFNLVLITSMLSLILVLVETYGRLIRNQPLFGKCDDDIICDEGRRYVRWRWGLSNRNWTTGKLRRRKKTNGEIIEEKIDDNDDNDIVEEEINIVMTKKENDYEYKDESCHMPCTN
ncbi:bacterial low temperature requirement A protein [Glomus cerebriforme]|uniref:Bacterial low temperature requirement A protein n=1 Tax=Glomus cerebriforme TaxID=658196 RepID=A0A397TDM8_9GLOM|nr:bacterial low temperature requirement A protein [Glomus cerebriforme]